MKTEVVSKEELVKTIEEKDRQIQYLEEKLDYLLRQKFTSKSEKINYNQPSLFDDTEEEVEVVEDEEIKIEFTRKKGGKRKPSKDLPRA